MNNLLGLSALLAMADGTRHPLHCTCCGKETIAMFHPPNKLVIRAKHHGATHELTLYVAVVAVESAPCQKELHATEHS